jgi:hypothetical protein
LEKEKISASKRKQFREAGYKSQCFLIHQREIEYLDRLGGDFRLFTAIYTTKSQAGSIYFSKMVNRISPKLKKQKDNL